MFRNKFNVYVLNNVIAAHVILLSKNPLSFRNQQLLCACVVETFKIIYITYKYIGIVYYLIFCRNIQLRFIQIEIKVI